MLATITTWPTPMSSELNYTRQKWCTSEKTITLKQALLTSASGLTASAADRMTKKKPVFVTTTSNQQAWVTATSECSCSASQIHYPTCHFNIYKCCACWCAIRNKSRWTFPQDPYQNHPFGRAPAMGYSSVRLPKFSKYTLESMETMLSEVSS